MVGRRKVEGRKEVVAEEPVCFGLPPVLLLVLAKASEDGPTRTQALAHKQVCSDGVKQKDGEIRIDGDKWRESVKTEEGAGDDAFVCVCVPVPEISLMAAVGF